LISGTYSNLENHPRLIRARDSKPVPKIRLDARTGLPTVEGSKPAPRAKKVTDIAGSSSATDDASDDEDSRRRSNYRSNTDVTEIKHSYPGYR
jgi:protein LTV1